MNRCITWTGHRLGWSVIANEMLECLEAKTLVFFFFLLSPLSFFLPFIFFLLDVSWWVVVEIVNCLDHSVSLGDMLYTGVYLEEAMIDT